MKLSFLLIPLAFFSCKTVKDSAITNTNQKETIVSINKEQDYNVVISINAKEPYCGGASPRDIDLNKVSVGVFNYLLIKTTTNDTISIESDALGIIYLNLKVGNYAIREIYKDMPFAQFQENNQPKANQALLDMDPDCYKKWWLKKLLKFEVSETGNIHKFNATINKTCLTGKNPCVLFTGELPK